MRQPTTPRAKIIMLRLRDDEYADVERQAHAEGGTLADVIRERMGLPRKDGRPPSRARAPRPG